MAAQRRAGVLDQNELAGLQAQRADVEVDVRAWADRLPLALMGWIGRIAGHGP